MSRLNIFFWILVIIFLTTFSIVFWFTDSNRVGDISVSERLKTKLIEDSFAVQSEEIPMPFRKVIFPLSIEDLSSSGITLDKISGRIDLESSSFQMAQALVSIWQSNSKICPTKRSYNSYDEIFRDFPTVKHLASYILKRSEPGISFLPIRMEFVQKLSVDNCMYMIIDGGSPFDGALTNVKFSLTFSYEISSRQSNGFVQGMGGEMCYGQSSGCPYVSQEVNSNGVVANYIPVLEDGKITSIFGSASTAAFTGMWGYSGPPSGRWSTRYELYLFDECPFARDSRLNRVENLNLPTTARKILTLEDSAVGRSQVNLLADKKIETIPVKKGSCLVPTMNFTSQDGGASAEYQFFVFVQTPEISKEKLYGNIDALNCSVIEGWVCNEADFSRNLEVSLFSKIGSGEEKFLKKASANIQREDAVSAQCGGFSNKGFSFDIANLIHNDTEQRIIIKVKEVGSESLVELKNFSEGIQSILKCDYSSRNCLPDDTKVCSSDNITYTRYDACVSGITIACSGSCPCPENRTKCPPLDSNQDNKIDIFDFSIFLRYYGKRCEI